MFFSLPDPGAFLFFFCAVVAFLATLLGVVLKLFGVLLLSWWWVFSPLPILFVGAVFIVGILSLLS